MEGGAIVHYNGLYYAIGSALTEWVLFMGDIWKPREQWDSRYLWMPLEIGEGKLWLPEPKPFSLNVRTGEVDFATD
jgi:hypothetical protein